MRCESDVEKKLQTSCQKPPIGNIDTFVFGKFQNSSSQMCETKFYLSKICSISGTVEVMMGKVQLLETLNKEKVLGGTWYFQVRKTT